MNAPLHVTGTVAPDWRGYFDALADAATELALPGEVALLSFAGEQSDFVRFNHGRVRQTGRVTQGKLTVRLIADGRQATFTTTVSGALDTDLAELGNELAALRATLRDAPEDPYLLYCTDVWREETRHAGHLPDASALARTVEQCARGHDFVGFYAGGPVMRGLASTLGSRGWYEVESFHFSWSLYDPSGRAIKTVYAGREWRDDVFAAKVEEAARRMPMLGRAPQTLAPGGYRAYLAPTALDELISVLGWSGFSAQARESSRSVLQKLVSGEAAFDPRLQMREDLGLGIAPPFDVDGYRRDSVQLIADGRNAGQLVSARSAREYGLVPNGASAGESPVSLAMAGGALHADDVLKTLDTGLYIGNLWYVNLSDHMNCRMTGMTRFATFWVERGEIVAPVEAMRFDDSLYQILGSQLEALTAEPEVLLNDASYSERATGGSRLPGVLLKRFELTL